MSTSYFSFKKFALYEGLFLAAASTSIAFIICYQFHFLLNDNLPLLLFTLNSIMLTFKFGSRFGFISFIIGSALSFYSFLPPYNSWAMPDFAHLKYFIAMFLLSILILGGNPPTG